MARFSFPRIATLTGCALGISALLAGCASPIGNDASTSDVTCAQYQQLDDQTRAERARTWGGPAQTYYLATGAEKLSSVEMWDRACSAVADPATVLASAQLATWDPLFPNCEDYAKVPPAVREEWAAELAVQAEWGGQQGDPAAQSIALRNACVETPLEAALAAAAMIRDVETQQPGVYAELAEVSGPDAGWSEVTWDTETELGYITRSSLRFGQPVMAGVQHPLLPEFVSGSSCGAAESDSYIPAELVMTNATDTDPVPLRGGVALVRPRQGGAFDQRDGVTDAAIEAFFSEGARCADGLQPSVEPTSNEPIDFEGQLRTRMFFVLTDYYSPRFPDGAVSELADWVAVGVPASADSGDPVIRLTQPSEVALDVLVGDVDQS